ncbi:glycosyltransferase family 4 protein [Blastococcus haudaquaticus]|uniref:Glycosyltransferase involved in cell wall bisynthesis n=1 Tax=Blastococcus haudaquaticus TaxID=1938745 RepID=A0A286GZ81_9ACTN|nr:glycosyltransferase [Blastococcus haudaquaticus]SOE00409.1 Glycosyltransferase involved in cell wall bisynthesis [Blastococcus haudaquaticus]
MTSESPDDRVDLAGTRVLHVVQKFSSGVGSAIAQYTHTVSEVEHHLLSGTPVDAEGDLAQQGDFASVHRMDGGHVARIRRVREVIDELRPDVVHAHSSHGGAYARLAVSRRRAHLVYTPHCYAFERRDVSGPVRAGFWGLEALLALNTSAVAACSPREWQLARWLTHGAPRHLVPNIAPLHRPSRPDERGTTRLVVGGGRLSPQKDPAYFLRVVHQLREARPGVRAVWLGDGDPSWRASLEDDGVEVSGWLPRDAVTEVLGAADLYLHSARWEGFPLMVAEAAALGVPTLVRRLPCFAGVPAALTLTADPQVDAAVSLLDDDAVAADNVAAWAQVLARNTREDQRAGLLASYSPGTNAG